MTAKPRVLVVDDSVVIRRLLREVLANNPEFEFAGQASNGSTALTLVDTLRPDAVTLDVEMPVMDGLTTLREIRKRHPRLPVIMFSTLTERGAAITIDCLASGASDYLTKPEKVQDFNEATAQIRAALLPRLRALCPAPKPAAPPAGVLEMPRRYTVAPRPHLAAANVEIVCIGCSTGGPNALGEILPHFPADFPVPVLIVQHMPPSFTQFLAQRLDKYSPLQVRQASAGELLVPGCAWVAPGDFHMSVFRDGDHLRIATHQEAPENSCRPSVDVLFRSVAEVFGSSALAVVLTGMGNDGLRGARQLASVGAQVIVQDEASSVVWGMPGCIAQAGIADAVLPLNEIAAQVRQRTFKVSRKGGVL